jgi:hypothetical protein
MKKLAVRRSGELRRISRVSAAPNIHTKDHAIENMTVLLHEFKKIGLW